MKKSEAADIEQDENLLADIDTNLPALPYANCLGLLHQLKVCGKAHLGDVLIGIAGCVCIWWVSNPDLYASG